MQMIAPCPGHRIFDAQTLHGGDCYGVPTQQEKTKADVTLFYFFHSLSIHFKLIQFNAPIQTSASAGRQDVLPSSFCGANPGKVQAGNMKSWAKACWMLDFNEVPNAESGVGMVPWIWYRSNHARTNGFAAALWLAWPEFCLEILFPEFHQQLIDCLVPIPDVQPGPFGDHCGTQN